jgi:hypothetical protein
MSDDFGGAFDDLALDAPVVTPTYRVSASNVQSSRASTTTQARVSTSNTSRISNDSSSSDSSNNSPVSRRTQSYKNEDVSQPARENRHTTSYDNRQRHKDDDDDDAEVDDDRTRRAPVLYPTFDADLQSPVSPSSGSRRRGDYHSKKVTKAFIIRTTDVAQLTIFDGKNVLFIVKIIPKEEKMNLIDAKRQLVAYIQKSPMALHQRYKLRLPNGFRVGKCTRRFKPTTERKFNYQKADTREVLKMVGPFGDYNIIKDMHDHVGSWQALEEPGSFRVEVNALPTDVFHIVALSMIAVLDHMANM